MRQKLIEILSDSRLGLSGVEIAEKLGINRATLTKYLEVFAAEGLIKQKDMGNAKLWFIESGMEGLHFPEDYFHVKEKFMELLNSTKPQQIFLLVRNSLHSGADITKMLTEVILPAIEHVDESYLKAKIGKSEARLLYGIISDSIRLLSFSSQETNPKKNVIVISADPASSLYSEAASCALVSHQWQVFGLGDMSAAIDVMYDLDLQKFLTRIWRQKQGIMVVLIFSASSEAAKFFSESASSIKSKFGRNLHIGVCSKGSSQGIKAEFVTDSFDAIIQWADSVSSGVS